MPDPANYSDRSSFMAACVPIAIEEGRSQEQAVAMCASMWSNKTTKVFEGAIFKTRKDIIKVAE